MRNSRNILGILSLTVSHLRWQDLVRGHYPFFINLVLQSKQTVNAVTCASFVYSCPKHSQVCVFLHDGTQLLH